MSQVATQSQSPTAAFNQFMNALKPQMALALPKHMNADRMARLALTAFSSSVDMQACNFKTIAASLMTAGALGLEPGVNGAGYLIPYKGVCTFVPGWKGLVDLVSRSGRATVWTGAVFEGDDFQYALGDRPFVMHRPGDETDPSKLTHVYAIGRVNGSEFPVIEVWSMRKVWKHRDEFNKQGNKHYSYRNPEMYARKVPLLQVLKYMPSSVEVANAIALSDAADAGRSAVIEHGFVVTTEEPAGDQSSMGTPPPPPAEPTSRPAMSAAEFDKNLQGWLDMINAGTKTADQLIGFLETKSSLTAAQKDRIRGKLPTSPVGTPDADGVIEGDTKEASHAGA